MEFQSRSGGDNSKDDEMSNASSQNEKNSHFRHQPKQIQILEAFFQECPHPDENQRHQLAMESGLNSNQIKFWFQNKRTQMKTQIERADNSALRTENENLRCENVAIKEMLKNVIHSSCGGPPMEEELQHSLHELQMENAHLREEHEKILNLLAKYVGKPIEPLMHPPTFSNPDISAAPEPGIDQNPMTSDRHLGTKPLAEREKAIMVETVTNATDELIMLVTTNDPVRTFPRTDHIKSPNARTETSQHSGIVAMNALQLVDLLLDAARWANFFSTIVTKAETIHVVEAGMSENRNGCLLLMHQQMHILSPLVPLREFYILRHCQQLELGLWAIVDVSYDWEKLDKEDDPSTIRAWKLPSGCMIQDLANGSCNVTWVERVQVDDRTQTHKLYRDLISGTKSPAYGAERWILTLQRMCEKLVFATMDNPPIEDLHGGVITTIQGRRNLIKLCNRMVKHFFGILNMSGKTDFPQLSEVNDSGVRVSVRKASDSGQPNGTIVSAATSLWIPLPYETVFNFFGDVKIRAKWDALCNGEPALEIANVTNGAHPGNCLKILRPSMPTENGIVVIQESYIDSLGSMVIYAPLDITCMNMAIHGGCDSRMIPILPSGFIISSDGHLKIRAGRASTSCASADTSGSGSLLTVAFQKLVSSPTLPRDVIMESMASLNTLISSTMQNIKASLNCSNAD